MSTELFTVERITCGKDTGKFMVGVFPPIGYVSDSVIVPKVFAYRESADCMAELLNSDFDYRKESPRKPIERAGFASFEA